MSHLSYLEKLLDGVEVEWKALGEVSNVLRGKRLTKSQLSEEAKFPVFHGGLEPLGYYTESNRPANSVMIINVGASAGTVGYSSVDFWSSDGCFCLERNEALNNRFLYFALIGHQSLLRSKVRVAGIPTLDAIVINKLEIPIPCPDNPEKSLAIQAEIVRILDAFTAMTAELTAELNMRKKQYNYYRDQLLSFDLSADQAGEGEVEWKTLGDLTTDKFWIMPATPKFDENEDVPYITSKNIRGGDIFFDKVKFISRDDFNNLSRNRPILAGDFLISMIGTIGEIARVKKTDLDFYGQNMYLIRLDESLLHSGYFLHFFDSPKMKSHFNAVKNNSGQGYLKANNIDCISVPVPSLSEQKRIAAILDKFDALTNSITEGLPREIELRQKQYEYYRDLLLSFPKSDEAA